MSLTPEQITIQTSTQAVLKQAGLMPQGDVDGKLGGRTIGALKALQDLANKDVDDHGFFIGADKAVLDAFKKLDLAKTTPKDLETMLLDDGSTVRKALLTVGNNVQGVLLPRQNDLQDMGKIGGLRDVFSWAACKQWINKMIADTDITRATGEVTTGKDLGEDGIAATKIAELKTAHDHIVSVQKDLKELGLYHGPLNGTATQMIDEVKAYKAQYNKAAKAAGTAELTDDVAAQILNSDSPVFVAMKTAAENSRTLRMIQTELKAQGHYKGTVDGDWGLQTEAALKAYGVTDPKKETLLARDADGNLTEASAVKIIEQSDERERIIGFQRNLYAAGYTHVKLTGNVDKATLEATEKFFAAKDKEWEKLGAAKDKEIADQQKLIDAEKDPTKKKELETAKTDLVTSKTTQETDRKAVKDAVAAGLKDNGKEFFTEIVANNTEIKSPDIGANDINDILGEENVKKFTTAVVHRLQKLGLFHGNADPLIKEGKQFGEIIDTKTGKNLAQILNAYGNKHVDGWYDTDAEYSCLWSENKNKAALFAALGNDVKKHEAHQAATKQNTAFGKEIKGLDDAIAAATAAGSNGGVSVTVDEGKAILKEFDELKAAGQGNLSAKSKAALEGVLDKLDLHKGETGISGAFGDLAAAISGIKKVAGIEPKGPKK